MQAQEVDLRQQLLERSHRRQSRLGLARTAVEVEHAHTKALQYLLEGRNDQLRATAYTTLVSIKMVQRDLEAAKQEHARQETAEKPKAGDPLGRSTDARFV